MDIRKLETDELEVECLIRNIDPKNESAIDNLISLILLEKEGKRDKPTLTHKIKASSEAVLCKKKLTELEKLRENLVRKGDVLGLESLRLRATHTIERLERLLISVKEDHNVSALLGEARKVFNRIIPAHIENIYNPDNNSVDPVPPTSQAPPPVPSKTGAVPKTAPIPPGEPPRSVGQLPSWNIDPSILVSGFVNPNASGSINGAQGAASLPFSQPSRDKSNFASGMDSYPIPPAEHPHTTQYNASKSNYYDFPLPNSDRADISYRQAAPLAAPVPLVGRSRPSLTHTLSKWTERFSGGPKDLPVDEFFFRVENLAAADNVHADSLVLGLHCLLTGSASDFYWVQRRKNPNHTWAQLKRSMSSHFARQETDLEIRKIIMGRAQAATEGFGEFSLAVECLAARLTWPMGEAELVEILRQNMSHRLQTCLLMINTPTVESLKEICRRFERLWANQADTSKDRRISRHMASLGFDEGPAVEEMVGPVLNPPITMGIGSISQTAMEANGFAVEALTHPRLKENRAEYMICWNCDDIGHSFVDCSSPERKVFCYGCGTKNTYKPSCGKCNPGNIKPNVINPGGSRSTPNPFALTRPNQGPPRP